jgi:hypothetical protein
MRISPRAVGMLFVMLVFAGCSATRPIVVSEWRNPAYPAGAFKRIMVGGLGGETSIRRNFEDEFVGQLRASGVDAVPSYSVIAEDDKIDEAKLKQLAQQAGADALLFARLVQVEQKTEYGPSYYPYTSIGIFGSNYSSWYGLGWYGLGGPPSVYRYNEYISETTLYDLRKNEVVWTGTIKTTQTDNMQTAIKSYVETVMKTLREQNLIGSSF